MSVKNKPFVFSKMIKDTNRNKTADGAYYHGHNIRFVSTSNEILGGFHFEKGNLLNVKIPKPEVIFPRSIKYQLEYYNEDDQFVDIKDRYVHLGENYDDLGIQIQNHEIHKTYGSKKSGDQIILGWAITVKGIVLITTDNNGFDCIWLLDTQDNNDFELSLLYMRDMGLSTEHPVEIINNYENDLIDKIYWVDSIHQLRHLTLNQSLENNDGRNLIDVDVALIEAISPTTLNQPKITEINYGGSHTAGMIQYAYTLYKMNGSQTLLSPTTELIPLGKGYSEGGGEVNELVGTSPTIRIDGLDTKFDNILVYSIKYTSLNLEPTVSIIEDRKIPKSGSVVVYDNGSIIQTSSIYEIKLLSNAITFPSTINTKDNSLFQANYKESNFEVKLDFRAYQFPSNPDHSARVYHNIYEDVNGDIVGDIRDVHSMVINGNPPYTNDPDDKFDSINLGYDYYKYQGDRKTLGGEGRYVKFQLKTDSSNDGTKKYLKDNEIYRAAIHFYNTFGQTTLPMWICDFKAPQGNLEGKPNIIQVTLKPEFYVWLNSQNLDDYSRPVGYKILIAERTNSDKTILASGLINPMMISNTQNTPGDFHEVYDNGNRVRVIPSRYNDLDNILKTKTKSPNPAFRNTWLDPSKTDYEILKYRPEDPAGSWNTFITRMIDTPLQKASHYRNLNSALIKSPIVPITTTTDYHYRFLTEFPSSKDKPDRYWNYQDSKIMQLYCPEAIFSNIPILPNDCTLEVRYAYKNTENYVWERMIDAVAGSIMMDGKIKNRLAVTVNAEQSSVNNVDWMTQNGPANWYTNMIELSQESNKHHATGRRPLPLGWSRSGMFSNYWGDVFGDVRTEHVTKTQLFYRRYGYTRDESVGGTYIFNPGIGIAPIHLSTTPSINITSVYNNDSNNIIFTDSLLDEYPTLDKILVTTTIHNIQHNSFSNDNILEFKSGINGDEITTEILNSSFTSVSNITEINRSDLNTSPNIINSVTIKNIDGINDLDGVIGYDVNFNIKDVSNTSLLNQTISSTTSYGVAVQSSGLKLKPDHVLKPNQTGTGVTSYKIYGRPISTKRGVDSKDYNGDGYFKFNNTLRNVGANHLGGTDTSIDKTIMGMNSEGSSCITFVLNPETKNDNKNAIAFEDLVEAAKFKTDNFRTNTGTVYAEIVRSRKDIYLGDIYGGNSYEAKRRTSYIEVGDYSDINKNTVLITSPGDTYVQDFRFLRISRGTMTKLTPSYLEHEEILEYLTETTVDLLNRNDKSFTHWDSDFSYGDTIYHKYNRVYSQKNLVSLTKNLEYSFKPVYHYNTTIIGSRKKINGELIDSWLSPLVNDSITLDGKFGPINKLLSNNDNIYAMQDRAVAKIDINPKIQYTDASGAELQLGTGKLLDDYTYITTTNGSLQWNCISTEEGIIFVDILDKSINIINGEGIKDLSVVNGFKHFMIESVNFDDYKKDNPITNNGISLGYDKTRGDVYMTFSKPDETFTLCYNMIQTGFSSFYDYNSAFYIPHKGELFTVNPTAKGSIYKSFAGKYNRFYGVNKPSVFEFVAAPEPLIETTFNNLEYKDEALNQSEEVVKSFETIQVDNEFQDSGIIPLKPKFNIRKLNRKWRLNIPRDNNKINRMRNTWAKIRLSNNNAEGYNHKISDIILYYTPNYKKVT